MSYVLGIDFGSTTGKAVILDGDGRVLSNQVSQKGAVSHVGVKSAVSAAFAETGLCQADIRRTVSTGYGRRMLDEADRSITEITCHARGAVWMVPDVRMVIDIGGQDSKVIAIDTNGLVEQFAMNDRCAGGTGKFLETLARAMDVDLDEMGPMALQAAEFPQVSSMCATFAETEVISLLAEGHAKIPVLAGVHAALAKRMSGLVSRVGLRTPAVMTGGVAQNPAAVKHIGDALGVTLIVPPNPQIAGALGAALYALDDLRHELRKADCNPEAAADSRIEAEIEAPRPFAPACKGPA
jgi:predicted CoA-substrate-specific enzyme activase